MNNSLLDLYDSKWDALCSAMQPILDDNSLEIKPTCPLLLTVPNAEEFETADIRIMVYGQETNSWYNEFHPNNQPIIECYDNFFNRGECWSYGGQFWNGVSRFISLLEEKYPDKSIKLLWNNIVKIGKYDEKGFPPDYIYEVERNHFSVIKDELEIIKPNVVLFLSGPNYDSVLEDNFGQIELQPMSPYSQRQLAKVKIDGIEMVFRTYHPNYLWRNNIDDYFNKIVGQINL